MLYGVFIVALKYIIYTERLIWILLFFTVAKFIFFGHIYVTGCLNLKKKKILENI